MTLRCGILAAILAMVACGVGAASDFEVTIRTESERVKFGDPLYIEVTIVNRGDKAVEAPPASLAAGTFGFRVYDPTTQLTFPLADTGGASGEQNFRYEPNRPVKHYWHVFLPGLPRLDHPFWQPIGEGGQRVRIWGAYQPRKRVLVNSDALEVRVDSRDADELNSLASLAAADSHEAVKGPLPHDLGLSFRSGLSREQTANLASKVDRGELHDLLLLSLRMMDIYRAADGARDSHDRALTEWLKDQPIIKRRVLLQELQKIAKTYNLSSTLEALKAIDDRSAVP